MGDVFFAFANCFKKKKHQKNPISVSSLRICPVSLTLWKLHMQCWVADQACRFLNYLTLGGDLIKYTLDVSLIVRVSAMLSAVIVWLIFQVLVKKKLIPSELCYCIRMCHLPSQRFLCHYHFLLQYFTHPYRSEKHCEKLFLFLF